MERYMEGERNGGRRKGGEEGEETGEKLGWGGERGKVGKRRGRRMER
jgi:hypothetical protein